MSKSKKDAVIIKKSTCFRCDGNGELCDNCGEAEAACDCVNDGQEFSPGECPDCKGSGK